MSAGQETALEAEAKALREKDVIYEAPDPQRNFLSPLSAVPKADGKIRPVVDLRALNAWLEYHHFKIEGIPALQDLLERGDFLAKVDLKEAYLMVPIAKEHHQLLGFEWRNRTYQFRALPFGLASAPFTSTKVLHPVIAGLRQLGIRLGVYLDDIRVMGRTAAETLTAVATLLHLLYSLGFIVNLGKSVLLPRQTLEFVGFEVCSVSTTLQLAKHRVQRILCSCREVLERQELTVRQLASCIGMLGAAWPGVLPAPPHLRGLQRLLAGAIRQRLPWEARIKLNQETRQDLAWWVRHHPRFSRMATQPDAVQAHPASSSAKPHRFVYDTNQRSTGAIRLLASRAVGRRYRRFRARLAQSRRLRLSTFLASESRDQSSASTEGSNPSPSDSIMEGSNLVSSTVGGGCSSSGPLAAVARLTPRPAGPVSSTSGEATTGTSRVAYLRTTYASAQFSPAVSELLLASWREGTGKHYNSTWRLWNSWCEPLKINPSCPPLKEVLSFLATQFNEERAYRTVSGYRSALSSTLPPFDGVAVGAHPLVARLMKGAYNLRPPKPRYTSTWDVGEVLTVLQTWGMPADLSDRQLSLKLVMLLALAGAHRTGEVRHLSIEGVRHNIDKVSLTVAVPSKTQRTGEPLRRVEYTAFENKKLCPVAHIQEYLTRTATWRSSSGSQLLLSFRRPHRPVATSTVARWLRSVLEASGIDMEIFRAHSTRGAATSAAAKAGISTEHILKTADWRPHSAVSTGVTSLPQRCPSKTRYCRQLSQFQTIKSLWTETIFIAHIFAVTHWFACFL